MAKKRTRKKAKAKKTMKRKVVKRKVKVLKRKKAPRRKAVRAKAKAPKKAKVVKKAAPKVLGKVTHYYDRIGVGIVELKAPLSVGDSVTFRRGDKEFSQTVSSMQIDHASVAKAKKGDIIGVKVKKEVKDGAVVLAG